MLVVCEGGPARGRGRAHGVEAASLVHRNIDTDHDIVPAIYTSAVTSSPCRRIAGGYGRICIVGWRSQK